VILCFRQKIQISQETQAMQNIIAMEVLSATSEKGFSLDELVFKTRELFEKEGLAGFVGLILRLTDERICMNMVHDKIIHSEQACCSKSSDPLASIEMHMLWENIDSIKRVSRFGALPVKDLRVRKNSHRNCQRANLPAQQRPPVNDRLYPCAKEHCSPLGCSKYLRSN